MGVQMARYNSAFTSPIVFPPAQLCSIVFSTWAGELTLGACGADGAGVLTDRSWVIVYANIWHWTSLSISSLRARQIILSTPRGTMSGTFGFGGFGWLAVVMHWTSLTIRCLWA